MPLLGGGAQRATQFRIGPRDQIVRVVHDEAAELSKSGASADDAELGEAAIRADSISLAKELRGFAGAQELFGEHEI